MKYWIKVLFISVSLISFSTMAQTGGKKGQKVRSTCGLVEASGKTFVVTDFESSKVGGVGSASEKFPERFTAGSYPYQDYRMIIGPLAQQKFRVATQMRTSPYQNNQVIAHMTIYEEVGATLTKRATAALPLSSLRQPYRLKHTLPGKAGYLSCIFSSDLTAKDGKRVPATSKK